MNTPTNHTRLDYLDAVRAFALILGIVFHASLSFLPFFIGWAVMDISTSSIVGSFMLISHSFRMELFFLIAGFFSHMTFHNKGAKSFIRSRFLRIAIPFLVGWLILKPLIISGWIMGSESMRGEVDILNGLQIGFQSVAQTPNEFLTGSHLWFLYYLLMITALTLMVRKAISSSPKAYSLATDCMDKGIAWLTRTPLAWTLLTIPTSACLYYMSSWGMDTPDRSLIPHIPVLIVYSGFFLLGWLLHRQQDLISHFARISSLRIILCLVSIGATLALSVYQTDMGHPNLVLIRMGFSLTYAFMMWTLVSLTIGLFKHFFNKPSKTVRYLADASYWLYLIHLPIVIWLQIAFAELPLHWTLKLAGISGLTIALSLVLYDLFVRSTIIGKVLNGRKRSRMIFRSYRRDPDLPGKETKVSRSLP